MAAVPLATRSRNLVDPKCGDSASLAPLSCGALAPSAPSMEAMEEMEGYPSQAYSESKERESPAARCYGTGMIVQNYPNLGYRNSNSHGLVLRQAHSGISASTAMGSVMTAQKHGNGNWCYAGSAYATPMMALSQVSDTSQDSHGSSYSGMSQTWRGSIASTAISETQLQNEEKIDSVKEVSHTQSRRVTGRTEYYKEVVHHIKQTGNKSISKEKRGQSLYWLMAQIKRHTQSHRMSKMVAKNGNTFEICHDLFCVIMNGDRFVDIKPNHEYFGWLFARCWMDMAQWVAYYLMHLFGNIDDAFAHGMAASAGAAVESQTRADTTDFSIDLDVIESKYSDDYTLAAGIAASMVSDYNNNDSHGSSNRAYRLSASKLDSKGGLWVDMLCMLTDDQIKAVSHNVSKIDQHKNKRTLWDLVKLFLKCNHIDSSKNFYKLIERLCKDDAKPNVDCGQTIEHCIHEDLKVLIINYQSKHWRDLKEHLIDVICKYRLMGGVLTHIFNEFKYHCAMKNITKNKNDTLRNWLLHGLRGSKHTGKALAFMVEYWEGGHSDTMNETRYKMFCGKLNKAMESSIFGARMDMWLVSTSMFVRQYEKDEEKRVNKNKELLNQLYFDMYDEMLEHTINLQTKQSKWTLTLFRSMLC